jgi:hypothetical protein
MQKPALEIQYYAHPRTYDYCHDHMANFTLRLLVSTCCTGTMSLSTVDSLDADGVPLIPLRRLSLRFALASRVSLNFHSFNCCRLFCDLAYAMAGVGLNPIPFRPVPSSSGSFVGSARCPVISLSCHVRADGGGGGESDLFRRRGCEEDLFCARDF